jgi:hypothetical protein
LSQAVLSDTLDVLPVLNTPWNPPLQAKYADRLSKIDALATEQTIMVLWNSLNTFLKDSFRPVPFD